MKNQITGIHHITAIASDPQRNVDFYSGLLGLRMIKKTVNFDDPSAYHLYYAVAVGTPGSVLTFFYWPGENSRGRVGTGQTSVISFSAPGGSLDFWQQRLGAAGLEAERVHRFGEEALCFADPDGIALEIVAVEADERKGWTGAGVDESAALRGFHTAVLTVRTASFTEDLLTGLMGFRLLKREGKRARFEAGAGGSGSYVDVIESAESPRGLGGVGTVHHIAWSVADDETELKMLARLREAGFNVSDVHDRCYFHSIYYRERGGILFEIATEGPGFMVDESFEELGTGLKLPPQYEHARKKIEASLPPLKV